MGSRYSTFWRRILAAFIDGILLSPLDWLSSVIAHRSASQFTSIAWYVIESVLFLGYGIWMHARFGQTVGKMAAGVIVVDVSEMRLLSFRQAVLRDIGVITLYVSAFAYLLADLAFSFGSPVEEAIGTILGYSALAWFVLEVLTMLTNDKRRALHDWIAKSVVLRKNA